MSFIDSRFVVDTDGKNISDKTGDLSALQTTNKGSLVAAINEHTTQLAENTSYRDADRYSKYVIPRHRNITANLRLAAFKGVLVGDSIAQGTGTSSVVYAIPSQLGGKLYTAYGFSGNDWSPVNYGVGGSTIAQCLAYLSHTLDSNKIPSKGYSFAYPYWIICTGRNDCNNSDVNLTNFSKLYRMAVRMGLRAGIDVICLTEPPALDMTSGQVNDPNYPAFADEIRLIAQQEGASLVDCHSEFLYRKDILKEDIRTYSSDGIHPNDTGYGVMADLIFRCLNGKGVPATSQPSKFDPEYLGNYVQSQYNTSSMTNASLVTLPSLATGSTSRKEVLGTLDVVEIQSGGSAVFDLPNVNASFFLLTMMSMSSSGTATVQCPTGFTQKSGMQNLASVNREFTFVITPSVNQSYPLTGSVSVQAVGGTIRVTGVHAIAPILSAQHATVNGTETGTWSTVSSAGFTWRESQTVNDTIILNWYGTDLNLQVLRSVGNGVIGYSTDGSAKQTFDCYLNATPLVSTLNIAPKLTQGWHTTTLSVETKNASASANKIDIKNVRTHTNVPASGRLIANIGSGVTVYAPDGISYVRSQSGIPTIANNQITNTVNSVIETVR